MTPAEPSEQLISFTDFLLQAVREASARGLSKLEIQIALKIAADGFEDIQLTTH